MTWRVLPSREWSRLEGTSLGAAWKQLPTRGVTILVVETPDQTIVGHWALFQCCHAEDGWIAPAHRKRGVVLRHLVRGMREIVATLGAEAFITAAPSPEITALLVGLGGSRLPGDAYSVPLVKG